MGFQIDELLKLFETYLSLPKGGNNHPEEVPLSKLITANPSVPYKSDATGLMLNLEEILEGVFAGRQDFRPEDYLYRGAYLLANISDCLNDWIRVFSVDLVHLKAALQLLAEQEVNTVANFLAWPLFLNKVAPHMQSTIRAKADKFKEIAFGLLGRRPE